MKAYVSGALTGIETLTGLKPFYEAIGKLCKQYNIDAYVPHLNTDPIKNPLLTAQDVYQLDSSKVIESDLVIAYVGVPSLGVGQEIEIAREHHIPVVLLMEDKVKISRMARGSPAVITEIRFSDYTDGLNKLSEWLKEWHP